MAYNNRLLMFVEGFGRGKNEPPPTGKVKFDVGAAELLSGVGKKRPRGKTATPERMVDYVAKIITDASKLTPRLPPGRNPKRKTTKRRPKRKNPSMREIMRDAMK